VELLDLSRLARQLQGLERRTTRGGKDSIDHAPGGHDDVANAVCGVLANITERSGGSGVFRLWTGECISGTDASGQAWRDGQMVLPPAAPPDPPRQAAVRVVPVVRIAHEGFAGGMLIEEREFDPKVHSLWREPTRRQS
jgi:hypothetical protein